MEVVSNLGKVMDNLDTDVSQKTLSMRLYRANLTKGKARIRLKQKNGEVVYVEIRDIE